jgi:hypothetical protein
MAMSSVSSAIENPFELKQFIRRSLWLRRRTPRARRRSGFHVFLCATRALWMNVHAPSGTTQRRLPERQPAGKLAGNGATSFTCLAAVAELSTRLLPMAHSIGTKTLIGTALPAGLPAPATRSGPGGRISPTYSRVVTVSYTQSLPRGLYSFTAT